MPFPERFIASTCPGVARPIRSPNPKLGANPNVFRIYRWDATSGEYLAVSSGDSLPAGSIFWLEANAAAQLFAGRPDLNALWREYDAGDTPEARFVKECDALDMALQALRYARIRGADTAEFITSARAKLSSQQLLEFLDDACRG